MASGRSINDCMDAAAKEWAVEAFFLVTNEIKLNVTGRVLHIRTGRLAGDIDQNARILPDGFRVGVRVRYGIGWELGFEIPAHTIRPKAGRVSNSLTKSGKPRRAMLAIPTSGGIIYRPYANQPARSVAARPFIYPAIKGQENKLIELQGKIFGKAIKESFPDKTYEISEMGIREI